MSFIRSTNSEGYAAPAGLTVDPVVITVKDNAANVLLIERAIDPYKGDLVLPGGFVGETESAEDTVIRKLTEKTGIPPVHLEQIGAFTDPQRDERGWIPSVAFLALVPASMLPNEDDWHPIGSYGRLGFDHEQIIDLAVSLLESKLWNSTIARGLLDESFTLNEARSVYETLLNRNYTQSNFGRDMLRGGLIVPTGEKSIRGRGRPSDLYRFA